MKNILVLSLALLATPALAGPEPLMQTDSSWDGGKIAYPEGEAEITAIVLRIEEGQPPPFHCHPIPTMGYVRKGTVEVETRNGDKILMRQGSTAVEVMRTLHRGVAVDGPAEVVVFYAGARDVPVTVYPEDDPENRYCNE